MKPILCALIAYVAVICMSVAGFAQSSSGTTAPASSAAQPAEHSAAELAKKLANPIHWQAADEHRRRSALLGEQSRRRAAELRGALCCHRAVSEEPVLRNGGHYGADMNAEEEGRGT